MAEVAGVAVGVISLGIQVCQGLYTYVDSVRARTRELDAASRQLKNVTLILGNLGNLIPRVEALPNPNADTINTLKQCMRDSENSISLLQNILTSLDKPHTQDAKGKAKDIGQRLAFGLRRSELTAMQEHVATLASTTAFALQIIPA